MIQGVEACGVGRGQSKYDDSVTFSCQLWYGNVVTAGKELQFALVGGKF